MHSPRHSMNNIVIGIDPGKKGGIAVFTDNMYVHIFNEEEFINIAHLVGDSNIPVYVYIEEVHAMPGQGVTSMFNFGRNFGWTVGVFEGNNCIVRYVTPQKWKKYFNLLKQDKKASIAKAKELYPDVNLLPTPRSKVDSDGMAESLLICEYGRRDLANERNTGDGRR